MLKKLFMGNAASLPKWVCVGHSDPMSQVRINFNTRRPLDPASTSLHNRDVTKNNIVIELRPQIVGFMFSPEEHALIEAHPDAFFLSLHDPGHTRQPGFCIGEIGLRYNGFKAVGDRVFVMFITTFCRNHCLHPLRIMGHFFYERVFLLFENDPHNYHKMKPKYLFNNWLIYSLPRAVALVSFDDGENTNMFPMDLIGVTDSPYFILSLTTIYPSTPYIKRCGKLAVSYVPLAILDTVYAMGKNNKRVCVPRDEMLVSTRLSPLYSIPVPEEAIYIREVEIVDSFEIGFHTIFVATTMNFERYTEEMHFCHVQRIYQRYLMDQARGLPYRVRQYKR